MRNLIVTADDFGISKEVNEAVESAHKNGILTATSLMVGEPFAEDAVRRARDMPDLGVGLHIALSRAHPVSPPDKIPDLVDHAGNLRSGLLGAGFRFYFSPSARRQLEAEITAQFEAFAKTGLPLDHVNAHNHLHLHPTVLGLMLKIGKQFGMKSIRWPKDNNSTGLGASFLAPWLGLMKSRLRKHTIAHNDVLLGLDETGSLDANTLISMIEGLSDQTAELMCHPATGPWDGMDPVAKDFRHDLEYKALIDDAVAKAIHDNNVNLIAYRDIK
ncbi:MAG: hopanoid biosynthesis-associated protein HpnK [Proteobacteria bacterium]|nr:hopanoid biosynthesis-associated protein HpnK [Pseudomonadota bacterium]MDA1023710.1 hopanoid biosynthesis-associated protein HpnK [Pseudomonadota bacterium]